MAAILSLFLMGCIKPAPEKVSDIHFSDARFMECVLNTGIDNVDEITRLDCPMMDIKHANEIKYFSQLSYIDLSANEITTLDFSLNEKLQHINVSGMIIESLKFGVLKHLKHLNFGSLLSNDLITKIDLESQFPNLEEIIVISLERDAELTLSIKHDNIKLINIISFGLLQENVKLILKIDAPLLTKLDLDVRGLDELKLKNVNKLEILSVINSRLTSLSLIGLENLKTVFLNNNKLNTLSVDNLPSLKILNVSHNELISLDATTLPELKELNASHNQLKSIEFQPQSKVTFISINNNKFESFDFEKLPNITHFSLKNNKLPRVEDAITNSHFLTCITNDGEYSYLLEIVSIYCLLPTYLNSLNLSGMISLTSIVLSDLNIKSGKLDLSSLKNLKYLDIKSRRHTISKLILPSKSKVEIIIFRELGLKTLTIPHLPKLKELTIYSDKLERFSLPPLPSLEHITLDGFSLTEFKMKSQPKLVEILFSNSGIKVQTIKNMLSLKKITLHNTQLEELYLYGLPNLEEICIRHPLKSVKIFSDLPESKIKSLTKHYCHLS